MKEPSSADDIERYSFLVMFANDGIIDRDELHFVEKLALRDGVIDDDERAVLRAIFARVDDTRMQAEVRAEIAAFRARYAI